MLQAAGAGVGGGAGHVLMSGVGREAAGTWVKVAGGERASHMPFRWNNA